MTRLRQRIAERLKEAQNTAAMLTTFNEVDMTTIMDVRNRYKDLRLPVAIIAGENDRVVWARRAEELAEKIPGSTLQILPGVGHMVHYAAPEIVLRAVEAVARRSKHAPTSADPANVLAF